MVSDACDNQLAPSFRRTNLPFSIVIGVNWIFPNKCNSPLHRLNLILRAKWFITLIRVIRAPELDVREEVITSQEKVIFVCINWASDERFNESLKVLLVCTSRVYKATRMSITPTAQMRCAKTGLCVAFVLRHDRHENQGAKVQRGQDGERQRDAASSLQGRRHGSGSGEFHREKGQFRLCAQNWPRRWQKDLIMIEGHIFTVNKASFCLECTSVVDYRKQPQQTE